MKNQHLIAIVILIIGFISCNQEQLPEKDIETDEQAIEAVEEVVQGVFDEVWSLQDETAITKYQTEDFLLLEHGEVWNNDTIANWCKRSKERYSNMKRVNSFKRINAKRNGNKVWLAYHNYGSFTMDTIQFERGWLESVVAVKQDSVWKLEMMHSTRQPISEN